MLEAERDENTCRKDLTPSEMYLVGQELEEILRPQAAARQAAAIRERDELGRAVATCAGPGTSGQGESRVRDQVASALGIGHTRYTQIKNVVEATNDPDPVVAEVAREAQAEMDATGAVKACSRSRGCQFGCQRLLAAHPETFSACVSAGQTGWA